MSSTTPVKSALFFFYCLAALTAIGTALSHAWQTHDELLLEKKRLISIKPS